MSRYVFQKILINPPSTEKRLTASSFLGVTSISGSGTGSKLTHDDVTLSTTCSSDWKYRSTESGIDLAELATDEASPFSWSWVLKRDYEIIKSYSYSIVRRCRPLAEIKLLYMYKKIFICFVYHLKVHII